MEPQNTMTQSFEPPKTKISYNLFLPILIVVAIVLGIYLYYQSDETRRTAEESINFLESVGKTTFAKVAEEEASNINQLPADVISLLPEDNSAVISAVTFDDGLKGYKILFKYNNQTFDAVQQYFSSTVLARYDFVEGRRDLANSVSLMVFENSEYFLKIDLLRGSDTSGDVFITVIAKK